MPIFIFVLSIIVLGAFVAILLTKPSDEENINAAKFTLDAIDKSTLPEDHKEYGKSTLRRICEHIISGRISGKVAESHLSTIAGYIIIGDGATKEELKRSGVRL